jgi:RNA polymerase sigma-70 factor (ECF subfamily)
VANSSEARFAELVLPEVEILGRVALSLTRNNADAEDLVQETMLRAYRAIDRFDGRYPRAWLMTIMRNAQINRVRRKRPELMRDPDEAVRVLSDTEGEGSTTEDNVMYAEFDPLVERAFTNLPEKFREVVELVDLNELSYQEAADALDVPVGTVMSRLHRGRRRIREELSDTDIGEMRQRRATDEVTP